MHAVNENNCVPRSEFDFTKGTSVVPIKLDDDAPALHDKHLLEIGNFAREGLVIMRWLGKSGLVREKAELKGRIGWRKKFGFFNTHIRANHFRVFDSIIGNHFHRGHVGVHNNLDYKIVLLRQMISATFTKQWTVPNGP